MCQNSIIGNRIFSDMRSKISNKKQEKKEVKSLKVEIILQREIFL